MGSVSRQIRTRTSAVNGSWVSRFPKRLFRRGWFPVLASLVFHLSATQTALPAASLNAPEREVRRAFDVNPIGANIDEVLATLANVAMKEKISRFASVGGAAHRTYNHVSQIGGLWSFGEIVTMLRTGRDLIGASEANRVEESPDCTVIRFRGASVDHQWFIRVAGRIYWLDFEGTIRISTRTGDIERLTWISAAGPPGSGIGSVLWDVNFSVATIADIPFTMPSDSIYRAGRTGFDRAAEWNLTQYAAVGRYGSTVTVRFGQ